MKTIIKGIKEVKRITDIGYDEYKMPLLNHESYYLESDEIMQELDFELITQNSISRPLKYYGMMMCSLSPDIRNITIPDTNGLQKLAIAKEYIADDCKTIIVDKILETEEQKFNYDEIMAIYNNEFNDYYDEFIKQFENDKPMQITINNWLSGGMTREDVINEIRKIEREKAKTNTIKISNNSNMVFSSGGIINTSGMIALCDR